VMGVPFLALSYDPKVTSFARYMEQPVIPSLAGITCDGLAATLKKAISCREDYVQRLQAAAVELKPRAMDNARLTVEYLLKGALSD